MANQSPYRGSARPPGWIVVTTGPDVPGYRITQILTVVDAMVLRGEYWGTGPREAPYREARAAAVSRLLEEARSVGANAIIAMRIDSNGDEVSAYGTAVTIAE